MGLNNYHTAGKAYGSLTPENVLVFRYNKPDGPLIYKLDKVMARKARGTITGDLRDLGIIYHWLYMNSAQNSIGIMPMLAEPLEFPEDIFTKKDNFVVSIIQGLIRDDPISIDTVLRTKEMRAAYVAFMKQYGISEAKLRLKNLNMYHGEYLGRCDGEGEIYFHDHTNLHKVKGWFKKGKI